MSTDWTQAFQGTRGLPQRVRDELRASSQILSFSDGDTVFSPGNVPNRLLFLLEGTVRVSQTSEAGREIVLYRIQAGESCVLTTAFILAEEAHAAEGVAEGALRAVALPKGQFDRLAAEFPDFREFVFAAYSRRLVDLLRVIDDVAFGRIDMRLAGRLLALAKGQSELRVTQAQLATELGTAREVVSRQLSEFQRRGWIEVARGRVTIADRAALADLADMPH